MLNTKEQLKRKIIDQYGNHIFSDPQASEKKWNVLCLCIMKKRNVLCFWNMTSLILSDNWCDDRHNSYTF